MRFDAVILAGGKSLRMGRDKAFIELDGQPLLARQIQIVRKAGAEQVFISGRAGWDYSSFNCPVLYDNFANAGPLAGIEQALAACAAPLLLVLAVDLPEMQAELLQKLLGACSGNCGVVPLIEKEFEPLAAFYPKAAQPLAESQLQQNHFAVKKFVENCMQAGLVKYLDLPVADGRFFMNCNSPAEAAMIFPKR